MRCAVYTLGCKVNQYETESILRDLKNDGFEVVDFATEADVYVINTCRVTERSEEKSRKALRRAARNAENAFLVVTGCYPEAADSAPGRALSVPNDGKDRIASYVKDKLGAEGRPRATSASVGFGQVYHSRALLKIQDGCDEDCSYCVVPQVRGRPRSRSVEVVCEEALRLLAAGAKELVVTGINLGIYGRDLAPKVSLSDAVAALLRLPGESRIRLSSVNVSEMTPQLLELSAHPRVCPHFHLPLQSGSDRVLKAMKRAYTAAHYRSVVDHLRDKRPGLALTTDIMVGFPGEQPRDFLQTMATVQQVGFRKIHVFKFSPRPGTEAATAGHQVDPPEATRRSRSLREVGEALARRYEESFVGQEVEALVEKEDQGRWQATSGNYLRVIFNGPAGMDGRLVRVRLTGRSGGYLEGNPVPEQNE